MSSLRRPRHWIRSTLLVVFALAALATGCGGGDTSDSTAADTTVANTTTVEEGNSGSATAELRAVDGSDASGSAVYSKEGPASPLLKINIDGLEPVSGDRQYVIWQVASRHDMVVLATYFVGKNGRLSEELKPNAAYLAALEDGEKSKLLVTRINNDDHWRTSYLPEENFYDPILTGKPILRGTFTGPLVDETGSE